MLKKLIPGYIFPMDRGLELYKQRLNIQTGEPILHDDAMVAEVYRVILKDGTRAILKFCPKEAYFLKLFAHQIPVPKIIEGLPGEGILMEELQGELLREFSDPIAFEIGVILAKIHLNKGESPPYDFGLKFQEGMQECKSHLPSKILVKCQSYYQSNYPLLSHVEGPCIIHRDFRSGNVMVKVGAIQGIIDWSSARVSFPEEDFCPLEHGEWPASLSAKKAFLKGYGSIRPVPNYSKIMPFLRMNRAIAAVGFTVKRGTWNGPHDKFYQSNREYLERF